MSSTCDRVLVPLTADSAQHRILLPATVLATWFKAPIQLVCDDRDRLPEYQTLAGSLGTALEPVLCLGEQPIDGLVSHAHSTAPSIIVTEASLPGLRIAAKSTQPVLLAADHPANRLPAGPLVVEITGRESDLDALALAAAVGSSLEEPIRLVVGPGADGWDASVEDATEDAQQRLIDMGCEVGIDRVDDAGHPLVLIGRSRNATAVVVPQQRLEEAGLVEQALKLGVNVLVAPTQNAERGRAAPFGVDLRQPVASPPDGATLAVLDRETCQDLLESHSIARLGYVEAGWPTVVPINYRMNRGDLFIRTLAGGKLRAAERRDAACLELDGYDEKLRTGWSVVAHGRLEVIGDGATLRQAWDNDPQPWVASDGWQWLRFVPITISGREVLPGEGT